MPPPLLSVRVIPNASRPQVVGRLPDGTLKVKVTAPPEGGRANAALIDLLALHFNVPRRSIKIVSGDTSRTKLLSIPEVGWAR